MYLIDAICAWLRDQRRPMAKADIIQRFVPPRNFDGLKPAQRRQAMATERHRRSHASERIDEAVSEGRLLVENGHYRANPATMPKLSLPIMPTVYRLLGEAPEKRLTERELLDAMRAMGMNITPRRLKNNVSQHITTRRIERITSETERWYALLPPEGQRERQERWDETREQTDRQRLESVDAIWRRLMRDQRFEDARVRTTFFPVRFDRAPAVVPRGSTSSQCAEGSL